MLGCTFGGSFLTFISVWSFFGKKRDTPRVMPLRLNDITVKKPLFWCTAAGLEPIAAKLSGGQFLRPVQTVSNFAEDHRMDCAVRHNLLERNDLNGSDKHNPLSA